MNKKIKWTGAILGVSYVLTCLSMFYLQKKFIYSPLSLHPENESISKIYNKDGKLLYIDFDRENTEQTLIIFHGRDKNAGYRSYFVNVFGKKSRLLVVEYPGFGENHQDKLNKKNILKHCHEAMKNIIENIEGPFTIVGESLGSGIASEMASYYSLSKLILITPYSTLADVAKTKYWFLPTKTLFTHNYDSVKNLKNYKGNVLFIISEHDTLVPTKLGKKLMSSFNGNKEEIYVLDATHYDWWDKMNLIQKENLKIFYEPSKVF